MTKSSIKESILDYLLTIVGSALLAVATAVFIRPINAPLGGLSGIAQVISFLTNLPMGILIIIMNIPLFLISWKSFGRKFMMLALVATVVSSVLIDLMHGTVPIITDNRLLSALYGGVIMGAGLGLVFSRGGTTGGSDIIAKLIHRRVEFLSMGRISLIINAIVISIATIVFKSLESALFALIVQFVSSSVIDSILHGLDHANACLIITPDADGMAEAIQTKMKRGVTGLTGHGMYSKADRVVLLVAVRSHEVGVLKRIVYEQHNQAFVIMLNANEVLGKGFKMTS